MAQIVRLGVAWITVALFLLFGNAWLAKPIPSATATVTFVWLFVTMVWSAFGAIKTADKLAEILGEPLGSLILTLTIIGLQFGYLLGGTILVESIFAWPGMGTYALNGILNLDFPVVLGVTTTVTLVFLTVNLLVDISYSMIDPRVRYG